MTALLIIVSALFLVQIFTNIFLLRAIGKFIPLFGVKKNNIDDVYKEINK